MKNNGSNKKKVLIVAGALGMGGLENQLVYLGKHTNQSQVQIDYSCTDPDAYYKQDILDAGCGFHLVPDPRKEGTIPYCCAMLHLMKQEHYDVVHSQELFHSGIEMFLAWLARIPKRIAHSHSTKDGVGHEGRIKKLYHAMMRIIILLFATDYLACSTAAGQFLYGSRITEDLRFRVILNSVETEQYFTTYEVPDGMLRKLQWRYVTHVGRFAEVKNHDFMIDIAAELKKAGLKIALVFVGDGELLEHCIERVRREHLEEYVQFLGQRKDVARILLSSDAFILPSHYEGMPLSVIEAQAAGLHCLVANHITEEVDFGLGMIHRQSLQKSAEQWVQHLIQILDMKRPRKDEIRMQIHQQGFDVSDFSDRLCEIYME